MRNIILSSPRYLISVLCQKGILRPNGPTTAHNLCQEFLKFRKSAFGFKFRRCKNHNMGLVMAIYFRPHIHFMLNRLWFVTAMKDDCILFADRASQNLCNRIIRVHTRWLIVRRIFTEVLAIE